MIPAAATPLRSVPPRSVGGAARARAARIARAALAALREELETYPKPGLVSLRDPGAHRDMDAATFLASIAALEPFFHDVARAGIGHAPFAVLRELGVEAEARMLRATGGVNTHRGAIFSLGLLAAAAGALPDGAPPAALAAASRTVFGPAIARELPVEPASHGAVAGRRHGVPGAREEAAAGFPHVFRVGLPALRASLRRGAGRRAAAVQALLALVSALPDTNLLHRGGAEGLAHARSAARDFLRAGGVHRAGWEARVLELHRDLVARRLSPGGSADLLAASLFVHRLGPGEVGGR